MVASLAALATAYAHHPHTAAKFSVALFLAVLALLLPLNLSALSRRFQKARSAGSSTSSERQWQKRGSEELAAAPVEGLPTAEQTSTLIKNRRSVFTKDLSGAPVARSTVEAMLEAANWAPTHGKTEPWRFVVLSPTALQDFITAMINALEGLPSVPRRDEKIAKLNSKRKKLGTVAWAITISFKRQAGEKLMPEWEELAATAAAVQNMHLMATALGACGYWTSWGPEEARDSSAVKRWLGLEEEDRCLGVFLLGSSNRADGYKARRGPIAEKVQWRP